MANHDFGSGHLFISEKKEISSFFMLNKSTESIKILYINTCPIFHICSTDFVIFLSTYFPRVPDTFQICPCFSTSFPNVSTYCSKHVPIFPHDFFKNNTCFHMFSAVSWETAWGNNASPCPASVLPPWWWPRRCPRSRRGRRRAPPSPP